MRTETPILIGDSGASVARIQFADGSTWIEKRDSPDRIKSEAVALRWCSVRLPVPRVLRHHDGLLVMSEIPGVNLTEVTVDCAVRVIVDALSRIHVVPVQGCPLSADWQLRLIQAEELIRTGMVDESEFDEDNLGRSANDILAELKSFPPLPDVACFTHGDACLPNFLAFDGRLSGIVDLGRAGVTHPAQDWALALRSMRFNFGDRGEQMLREHVPDYCAAEELLRRFRLLDELF